MASKALFAALEIGLFTVLADGPLAPVDLADRTGLAAAGCRTLLHALAGLGLLVRDGDMFGNAPAAERYLVRGRARRLRRLLPPADRTPDLPGAAAPRRRHRRHRPRVRHHERAARRRLTMPARSRPPSTSGHSRQRGCWRIACCGIGCRRARARSGCSTSVAAVGPSLSRSARGSRRCGPPSWTSRRSAEPTSSSRLPACFRSGVTTARRRARGRRR